jgi:hypothetical protein
MKKLILSFIGVACIAMASHAQCSGAQLKNGADSFKLFTNGSQVYFDFCGKEGSLLKHQALLHEVYPTAQFSFQSAGNDLFNCTLTLNDVQQPEYAAKIMVAMGFEVVFKGEQKLTINESSAWFK